MLCKHKSVQAEPPRLVRSLTEHRWLPPIRPRSSRSHAPFLVRLQILRRAAQLGVSRRAGRTLAAAEEEALALALCQVGLYGAGLLDDEGLARARVRKQA